MNGGSLFFGVLLILGIWLNCSSMVGETLLGPSMNTPPELIGPLQEISETLRAEEVASALAVLVVTALGLAPLGAHGLLVFGIGAILFCFMSGWLLLGGILTGLLVFAGIAALLEGRGITLNRETIRATTKTIAGWWQHWTRRTPAAAAKQWSWWDESREEDNKKLDEQYRKEWERKPIL